MMRPLSTSVAMLYAGMVVAWLIVTGCTAADPETQGQTSSERRVPESRRDSRQNLVGTWHRTVVNANMTSSEDVELRGDGTYTSRLHYVVVRGSRLEGGGVHDGSWSATGTRVQLSGGPGTDGSGSWPPTVLDLQQYQKVN